MAWGLGRKQCKVRGGPSDREVRGRAAANRRDRPSWAAALGWDLKREGRRPQEGLRKSVPGLASLSPPGAPRETSIFEEGTYFPVKNMKPQSPTKVAIKDEAERMAPGHQPASSLLAALRNVTPTTCHTLRVTFPCLVCQKIVKRSWTIQSLSYPLGSHIQRLDNLIRELGVLTFEHPTIHKK